MIFHLDCNFFPLRVRIGKIDFLPTALTLLDIEEEITPKTS
jgi:hypothetical protein